VRNAGNGACEGKQEEFIPIGNFTPIRNKQEEFIPIGNFTSLTEFLRGWSTNKTQQRKRVCEMGQANDRGTFEERRDKAILRRETERKEANARHLAQYEARQAERAAGMKKRSPVAGIMLASAAYSCPTIVM
jgi:hypothetical protein